MQPWRSEAFKFSADPDLVAKVTDIVGCISIQRRTRLSSAWRETTRVSDESFAAMSTVRESVHCIRIRGIYGKGDLVITRLEMYLCVDSGLNMSTVTEHCAEDELSPVYGVLTCQSFG
ncbi:hypothetical protein SZ00_06081 (plasmid) [Rhodococcus sp. AD45]|nr:hypothetical protein SZ00_06081 [Rhodococcus sp. AD45]